MAKRLMAKFNIVKGCLCNFRSYKTNTKFAVCYITEVNFKENKFTIYRANPVTENREAYLSLNVYPKRILDNFEYSIEDFTSFDNVEAFFEIVAEHIKLCGNNIHASFSDRFMYDYDLDLVMDDDDEVVEKIKKIKEELYQGNSVATIDAGNGSSGLSVLTAVESLEHYEYRYIAEFVTVEEFEDEFEHSVEDCFCWLDPSDIEGFVKFTDPDNMESNPWRLYVAVYIY